MLSYTHCSDVSDTCVLFWCHSILEVWSTTCVVRQSLWILFMFVIIYQLVAGNGLFVSCSETIECSAVNFNCNYKPSAWATANPWNRLPLNHRGDLYWSGPVLFAYNLASTADWSQLDCSDIWKPYRFRPGKVFCSWAGNYWCRMIWTFVA